MRILAVDDDTHILEILKAVLTDAGYDEVTTTPSPLDALEMVEKGDKRFDCLLLDIQMPEMDGITLCDRLRRIDGYASVPIVMLTAMAEREYVERAFKAGATDYLTKPFDVFEITARLRVAAKLCEASQEVPDTPEPPRPRHYASRRSKSDGSSLSRQELVDLFADEFKKRSLLKRAG